MLELGHVGKAHGLRGEVICHLVTDRTGERMRPGAYLSLGGDGASPEAAVAVEVASARPHTSGGSSGPGSRWLVRFAGIETREAAEALRGRSLLAEPIDSDDLLDDDVVFVHELIGRRLVDQHGTDHGPIVSVIDNPASDLLELDGGRLVPLAFYVEHDDEVVAVEVPAGLLDDDAVEATPDTEG